MIASGVLKRMFVSIFSVQVEPGDRHRAEEGNGRAGRRDSADHVQGFTAAPRLSRGDTRRG